MERDYSGIGRGVENESEGFSEWIGGGDGSETGAVMEGEDRYCCQPHHGLQG